MHMRRVISSIVVVSTAAVALSTATLAQAAPAATAPALPPTGEQGPPPAPPAAPEAPAAPIPPATFLGSANWKFGFHGLAGVSVYVQDSPGFVLNGQGPLLVLNKPAYGYTTGADIRQSRFNFSLAGPKAFGATPKAVLEVDLFGLNSPGGFGEVSAYARVRLAYAELNWGNAVLRFGQDYQLILALLPESMGHMAFPVTYFNGMLGWREPGVGYFHTIPLEGSKLELAVQLMKSDWRNPTDFGMPTTNDLNVDYGQLSGWLGVEGRVKWTSENVTAFVSGHYNHVEGTHAGSLVAAPMMVPDRNWDVVAGVAGVKVTLGPLTVAGSAYVGKNLAPLLGELLQFVQTNDVNEWGLWAQVGYNVTKNLNLSIVGGGSQLDTGDVEGAGGGRLYSDVLGGMVRYQDAGFAVGPEFYHIWTKTITAAGNDMPAGAGAPGELNANQFMLSGMYFF